MEENSRPVRSAAEITLSHGLRVMKFTVPLVVAPSSPRWPTGKINIIINEFQRRRADRRRTDNHAFLIKIILIESACSQRGRREVVKRAPRSSVGKR